jgi:uncharacterized NAD(P)/FAD-binding protein YdhS
MNSPLKVVIAGGGLSGTLTAINLVKQATGPIEIVLAEKNPSLLYRGAAYQKENKYLPLNVPVKRMSLFSNEPDHLRQWLEARKEQYGNILPDAGPDAFIARGILGDYIVDTVEKILTEAPEYVKFRSVTASVVSVEEGGQLMIGFDDGATETADKLVLAIGNFPPINVPIKDQSFYSCDRYIPLPWTAAAVERVGANEDVLILGAGLTMVDVLISLDKKVHKGKIYVLSRNGLLPRAHGHGAEVPAPDFDSIEPTALGYYQLIKKAIKDNPQSNWIMVVESLRGITTDLWKRLPINERKQFLRHLKTFWEVHRHRIPQASQALIDRLKAEGRLIVYAGKLEHLQESNDGVQASFIQKGTRQPVSFQVDKVINCTGPTVDYSKVPSPLVRDLLDKGLAVVDELCLGFKLAENGAIIGADGQTSTKIFTLGPVRKGDWWESTALREIRMQSEQLPKDI